MEWVVGLAAVALVVLLVIVVRRGSRRSPTTAPAPRLGIGGLRTALAGDDADWERVEAVLVGGDVGVAMAGEIVARARQSARRHGGARAALAAEMVAVFAEADRSLALSSSPSVVVVVGVNGSGKTTTIAKLAAALKEKGSEPLLAATDTFRAAAVEQLREWGRRLGVDVVGGAPGGDAAAVAFDALAAARARGCDVVIVDTAGRLHSKANLMDELEKVVRVLEREAGHADEILLVLDGSTGQNAIAQAEAFTAAVGVTGIVLTKMDGTARGGVALAVEHRLGIPVKLVGVGEGPGDLLAFEPVSFVERLLEGS